MGTRNSSVGIAVRLRAARPRNESSVSGSGKILFFHYVHIESGVPTSSGVIGEGREADCSPVSSAEVKNDENIPPLHHTSYLII